MKKIIIGTGLLIALAAFLVVIHSSAFNERPYENKNKNIEVKDLSREGTGSKEKAIKPSEKIISEMTLEEKIGQMVIVGFEGYVVNEHVKKMIHDYHVGGFILFGKNVQDTDQLLNLLNGLKQENKTNQVPLFLSVDEEGGRVTRLPKAIESFPSSQAIGRRNDKEFSLKVGKHIGRTLKDFGFNMDFAPVLDISSNPKNTVIGDRAFGSTAEIVSKLGIETMKGLETQGVIPVVKHFPGHGDTTVDSHIGLPKVSKGLEELEAFELIPFIEAIDHQADAIMVAHILLPKIDDQHPATLSKPIVTELMRNKLGFDGLILTDDLTMGAIMNTYSIEDAAIKSVQAGNDVLLICHDPTTEISALDALKGAVKDGRISEKQIDDSVYRVLKLKEKYGLRDASNHDMDVQAINQETKSLLNKYLDKKN